MLIALAPAPLVPATEAKPIYARIIDRPRPQPLGSPAPVIVTLIPVTRPKLPTPVVQPIEIETLDSPAPGPDPAPSSAQLVTRPGPANGGGKGYPASVATQAIEAGAAGGAGLFRPFRAIGAGSRLVADAGAGRRAWSRHRSQAAWQQWLRAPRCRRNQGVGKWRFEPPMQNGRPVECLDPGQRAT